MEDDAPLTLGIDEAGRGSVLGPLVVAGCALDPLAQEQLRQAGVDDSKAFGPPARAQRVRAELATLIESKARWYRVIVVSPARVDASVRRQRLNALEREVAEELLADAPRATRIVLDGRKVFGPLARRHAAAVALDRADREELAVAAASILAKTTRDRCFAEICGRYEPEFGPIDGGGYPNRATERFLAAYTSKHGALPPETRRSWSWEPLRPFTTPAERGDPLTLGFED